MTRPERETSDKAQWRKPVLTRLGALRDIAQQGPPFSQGNGQFS